jgi:hypothetical protein
VASTIFFSKNFKARLITQYIIHLHIPHSKFDLESFPDSFFLCNFSIVKDDEKLEHFDLTSNFLLSIWSDVSSAVVSEFEKLEEKCPTKNELIGIQYIEIIQTLNSIRPLNLEPLISLLSSGQSVLQYFDQHLLSLVGLIDIDPQYLTLCLSIQLTDNIQMRV